jgi:hypothetical protein
MLIWCESREIPSLMQDVYTEGGLGRSSHCEDAQSATLRRLYLILNRVNNEPSLPEGGCLCC